MRLRKGMDGMNPEKKRERERERERERGGGGKEERKDGADGGRVSSDAEHAPT